VNAPLNEVSKGSFVIARIRNPPSNQNLSGSELLQFSEQLSDIGYLADRIDLDESDDARLI